MKQIAIFASGNGSNFEAIYQATIAGTLDAQICLLVSDNPDAYALIRAQKHGINYFVFNPKDYQSKADYEAAIVSQLNKTAPDLIVLAGYMRMLGKTMLDAYEGTIINIHPSLLPEYKGMDAIGQAIASKASQMGVTVHYVDVGMDTGAIIAQEGFAVAGNESRTEIEERVHAIEHRLYPQTIAMLLKKENEYE